MSDLKLYVSGKRQTDFEVIEWLPRWRWLPKALWERWPKIFARHVMVVKLPFAPVAGDIVSARFVADWRDDIDD